MNLLEQLPKMSSK